MLAFHISSPVSSSNANALAPSMLSQPTKIRPLSTAGVERLPAGKLTGSQSSLPLVISRAINLLSSNV